MSRTPEQLREAAGLFRAMADSCSTSEAKEALLEVGRDLEEEADQLGPAGTAVRSTVRPLLAPEAPSGSLRTDG